MLVTTASQSSVVQSNNEHDVGLHLATSPIFVRLPPSLSCFMSEARRPPGARRRGQSAAAVDGLRPRPARRAGVPQSSAAAVANHCA
jgi:hypothetical protein